MRDERDVVARVLADERALLRGLAGWALVSVLAGARWSAGPARAGARGRDGGPVAGAARQAVAWGLVDLAIAGWGARGLRRARRAAADGALDVDAARARARRLGRLTAVNAALDVGYVATGAVLAARSRRLRGDGVGVVVQGLALLVLDVRHARAARRVMSAEAGESVGGAP